LDKSVSAYINGETVSQVEKKVANPFFKGCKSVLGGTLEEKNCASFFLKELIISERVSSDCEIKGVAKYLWLEWNRLDDRLVQQ